LTASQTRYHRPAKLLTVNPRQSAMSDDCSKKRPASASLSDLDLSGMSGQTPKATETNNATKDSNLFPVFKDAKQTKKGKKAKVEDDTPGNTGIEQQLSQINEKLSNMLTKKDTGFLKQIIKDTICELKDELLKPLVHRIEILESDVMDQAKEIENFKKELTKKDTTIEHLTEENKHLEDRVRSDEDYVDKVTNDLEQYGRRNNIRISGIDGDANRQTSETTTTLVINTIKEKTGFELNVNDIDVAHRLGKYRQGKQRPVIVKFVRRQTKIQAFSHAKQLRQSAIYINEDLTKTNQEVLSSVRLKDRDSVKKAWSHEGKIYVIYNQNGHDDGPHELQYKQYHYWLNRPWPVRNTAPATRATEAR